MACHKSYDVNVKLLTIFLRHWSDVNQLVRVPTVLWQCNRAVPGQAYPGQGVFNSRCFSSLAPYTSVSSLNRMFRFGSKLWARDGHNSCVQQMQTSPMFDLFYISHTLHKRTHTPVREFRSERMSKSFLNPVEDLQRYVSVPIFSEEQAVFHPSEAEIVKAMQVFRGSRGSKDKHPARFVGAFVDGDQIPDMNMPEVCFLGRSNVGKSSLISMLLNAQVNVRVSKKPGHTKTLNLFRTGRDFTLVDMPGYGYNMPRNFQQSVERYLSSRRRLCRTFLLVDGEVGLASPDYTAVDMLREFGVPYVVVLTKIDKAGKHKLIRNVMNVMETIKERGGHTCFSQPFLVSSKTADGVVYLQTFIAYITGSIQVKGL